MDTRSQRTFLYVTRTPNRELQDRLVDRGWHIVVVESSREAQKLIDRHELWGGLLDLSSGYGSESYHEFEDCLSRQNVGWVMAVMPEQIEKPSVRKLICRGCFDYVTMPCSPQRLADTIGHAYGMAALTEPGVLCAAEEKMVGASDAMQHLFRTIVKVASTSAPVFISGDSGTGKELTAAAIHQRSSRRNGPFVAINCGAIPHSLVQSELYGYERGAFTGANRRRIGRIEAANGGTLFLDEIGDLPMESQASLLRFLQEGQIERLGGCDPVSVDVRVISATHVDIEGAVRDGHFRSDLYHRLCVLRIDEPPLRARGKDIELLANHMLDRYRDDSTRRLYGFSSAAIEALYNYEWPGNVRELINRVRRAIVMAEGRVITAEDLGLSRWATPKPVTLADARDAAEQYAIQQALLRHRNRLNEAAQELGISRVTLYRLMDNQRLADLRHAEDGGLRPVA